ncbi:MAG: sugar-binding transcriptional regulator [Chloroflexota bacterium]|nr:sugar-binding transcriptional regulator [Chloroflexota bacterium]
MNETQKLMVKIAKMYYEEGLTQTVISKRMGISRPKVSRLMQESMDQGIIRIEIASIPGDYSDLMQLLQSKYGLVEAIVVKITGALSYETVSHSLGIAAAKFFKRIVKDGDVIGMTWGSALASMVAHLDQEKKPNCLVVQMVGGLGSPNTNTHATDLVIRTAMALEAKMSLMPAPGVVGSVDSAELLIADRHISQALEFVKKTTVAFVGIGATKHNPFLMKNEEIITWGKMAELRSQGAVGDISLHFFDLNGLEIDSEFHRRVIGASYEVLKRIPRVVGIAGGPNKYEAILGAIQGGLINTLITDTETAQRLIEE